MERFDDPAAAGRLQRPDEPRVAVFDRDEQLSTDSPATCGRRASRGAWNYCANFANENDGARRFVHPVVRAILLHFWLAHDHPFDDGNGRTARILFFWLMQSAGLLARRVLADLPHSARAPAKYARAFLETETDAADTTYFLIHQLRVIEQAIEELHRYLKRKSMEIREVEALIRGGDGFNHRQLALLSDALRHPERSYSFGSHAAVTG